MCWSPGLGLLVAGGITAGASWPSTTAVRHRGRINRGGAHRRARAGRGQLFLIVGVIGTGVHWGMGAHAQDRTVH
jgi:hypothetical protein